MLRCPPDEDSSPFHIGRPLGQMRRLRSQKGIQMATATQAAPSTAPAAGTQLDPINVKTIRGCAVYFHALHEAGHAVVAAHLRLPFHRVTIVPDRDMDGHLRMRPTTTRLRQFVKTSDGAFRKRTDGEMQTIFQRQLKKYHRKQAIMTLAARAACEAHGFNAAEFEPGYGGDEEALRKYFEWTSPNETFEQWRSCLLDIAHGLVTTPYIAEAIFEVAIVLQIAVGDDRGVPAKDVRTILNAAKSQDELNALLQAHKAGA